MKTFAHTFMNIRCSTGRALIKVCRGLSASAMRRLENASEYEVEEKADGRSEEEFLQLCHEHEMLYGKNSYKGLPWPMAVTTIST